MSAVAAPAGLRPQVDRRRLAIAASWHAHLSAAAKCSEHLSELRELLGDVSTQVDESRRGAVLKGVALVSSVEEQSASAAANARRAFEALDVFSRGG